MVNIINTLTEKNKELLAKIEELENKEKTEISCEAQLKIIDKIEQWKKQNYETGDILKKYENNTYPAFIEQNRSNGRGVWKSLAGHVNSELKMVQYLDREESPLDGLIEMMLNSIMRNVVSSYNWQGQRDKELEEKKGWREKARKATKEKEEKKIEIGALEREMKEKKMTIKHLEEKLQCAELDAKTHYDFIGVLQKLNGKVRDELHEEIENNLELLEETKNNLEEQKVRVEELEKEKEADMEALQEVSEQLEEQKKVSKRLQGQIDLDKKPLPKIPSKFKLFKQKTQAKFKQFQHLAKKAKVQTQEFIARIEVKTK